METAAHPQQVPDGGTVRIEGRQLRREVVRGAVVQPELPVIDQPEDLGPGHGLADARGEEPGARGQRRLPADPRRPLRPSFPSRPRSPLPSPRGRCRPPRRGRAPPGATRRPRSGSCACGKGGEVSEPGADRGQDVCRGRAGLGRTWRVDSADCGVLVGRRRAPRDQHQSRGGQSGPYCECEWHGCLRSESREGGWIVSSSTLVKGRRAGPDLHGRQEGLEQSP